MQTLTRAPIVTDRHAARSGIRLALLLLGLWTCGKAWCHGEAALSNAPDNPYAVSYITIDASEGQASGGHAAIRFGPHVYHFEFEDGFVRAVRDDFMLFQHHYRLEDNRSLTMHPLALENPQEAENFFAKRVTQQNNEWAYLEKLDADIRLLEQLDQKTPHPRLAIRGAGLFEPLKNTWRHPPPVDHDLSQRRMIATMLAESLHPGVLVMGGHQKELSGHLQPNPKDHTAPPLPYGANRSMYHLSERYHDTFCLLWLLEAIEEAIPLNADALVWLPTGDFPMSGAQRRQLKTLEKKLRQELRSSLQKPFRPDMGPGLLVRLARLHALNLSLHYNRWVLLNRKESSLNQSRISITALDAAHEKRMLTWRALTTDTVREESDYHLIELAANAISAINAMRQQGMEVNWKTEGLADRSAIYSHRAPQSHDWSILLEEQRQAREVWQAHLEEHYRYHLLDRNCVTEIFRTLRPPTPAVTGLPFSIPGLSGMALGDLAQQATPVIVMPSRRVERWQQQSETGAWIEKLSELLPWSEPAYAADEDTSSFLFHTDTTVLGRPILGSANMGYATINTLTGMITWPQDGGLLMYQGAKGILMSMPELFFFNIRKGHFLADDRLPLPEEERPPLEDAGESNN